jgi:hypothetical protein
MRRTDQQDELLINLINISTTVVKGWSCSWHVKKKLFCEYFTLTVLAKV